MAARRRETGAQALLAKSQQLAEQAVRWHEDNRHAIEAARRAVEGPLGKAVSMIAAHRDQIDAALTALDAFNRQAADIEGEWGDAGLGYLVTPLGVAEQLVLSLHAAPGETEELFDFLEVALADPEFVRRTQEGLDDAAVLSEVARSHLKHGLDHLASGDPLNAWPPLIIGLEGAFADVAVNEGVAVRVDNHVHLVDQAGQPAGKVGSVEGIAKVLGHASDETDFGEFLVRKVYGGEGNPFRHGLAREGIRERALCLAVAVVGWLDAFVTPGSRKLLRGAMVHELERREESA